jgi:hypothetical protein
MTRPVFGALIALMLLGLYAYAVIDAIAAAECLARPGCTGYTPDLTHGIVVVLNLVGSLVSALVISELAVTPPGKAIAAAAFAPPPPQPLPPVVRIVATAYVVAWLLCGGAAFVVGFMQHPDLVPALTSAGEAWLGLAVAAGYAYFGLKPA